MAEPLPLFPLNVALVPGLVLPLHIFEPRYRGMVQALLARPEESQREFGIIAVREGRSFDRDGIEALYPIGTATVLRSAEALEDGRYDIVTTGSRRFRLVSVDRSSPLAVAIVEFLEDVAGPDDAALASRVVRLFDAYRRLLGGQPPEPDERADDLPDDPTVLGYLITAAMVLPMDERQELLAMPDTAARLGRAASLLARENGILSVLGAVPAIDLIGAPGSPN